MILASACDTYSRRCDWIVAQMVAAVSPSYSRVRSTFPMKSVKRVTYAVEAVHLEMAAAAAAVSSGTVVVVVVVEH